MEETKKTRKASATYTMKSYVNNAKKLLAMKLITEEEAKQLAEIHNNVINRHINGEQGIT